MEHNRGQNVANLNHTVGFRPDRLSPVYGWQHYFDNNGRTELEDVQRRLNSQGLAMHADFPFLEDDFCLKWVCTRIMRNLRKSLGDQPPGATGMDLDQHVHDHLRSIGLVGYAKPQGTWQRVRFAFLFWNRSFRDA